MRLLTLDVLSILLTPSGQFILCTDHATYWKDVFGSCCHLQMRFLTSYTVCLSCSLQQVNSLKGQIMLLIRRIIWFMLPFSDALLTSYTMSVCRAHSIKSIHLMHRSCYWFDVFKICFVCAATFKCVCSPYTRQLSRYLRQVELLVCWA
jgi:hypothetical protein